MRFVWDERKRQQTLKTRNIDFRSVVPLFTNHTRIVIPDNRRDYGEDRFHLYGLLDGNLFHVTFTVRDDAIRIISARRANKRERRSYEHRFRNQGYPYQ